MMTAGLRKLVLTAHIASSVSLLGAVGAFLALAIAGLFGQSPQMMRAAYLATELIAWLVIVPLAFASLLTGVVQSVGTHWGLFQHYWVLAKLLLTGFVTIILLLQMKSISYLGDTAEKMGLTSVDLLDARISLVAHAGGGLLVLLIPTALSVYKPRGMTQYGRRKRQEEARTLSP